MALRILLKTTQILFDAWNKIYTLTRKLLVEFVIFSLEKIILGCQISQVVQFPLQEFAIVLV